VALFPVQGVLRVPASGTRNNDVVLTWIDGALSVDPGTHAGHPQGPSGPERPSLDRY
jgi:hypothetical protein